MIGEAFTTLRYDKRVSPRRDASVALTALALVDDNPDTFRPLAVSEATHNQARGILEQYWDHAFSYIDAVIFQVVDEHQSVSRILTVDGADFRSYKFKHHVEIATPA